MKSTNYYDTFILVAEDCPVAEAEVPAGKAEARTVAELQYRMIAEAPYTHTSDDVLFEVHAQRHGVPDERKAAERAAFFAKSQACMRASPLGKRYGWGLHHDARGRVALVALGSERYQELAEDEGLKRLKAMRSKRA